MIEPTLLERAPWPWHFDDMQFIIYDADGRKVVHLSRPPKNMFFDWLAEGIIALCSPEPRDQDKIDRMLHAFPAPWSDRPSISGYMVDANFMPTFGVLSTRGETEQEQPIKQAILAKVCEWGGR